MKKLFAKIESVLTEKRRKYVYRVATLALLILATYGLIGPGELELWTLLAAAVTGMADRNTTPEVEGEVVSDEQEA